MMGTRSRRARDTGILPVLGAQHGLEARVTMEVRAQCL